MDPSFDYSALYEPPKGKIYKIFPELGPELLGLILDLLRGAYFMGLQGWYKDLDYSSDANYCNGPARTMAQLEANHGIDAQTLFELFSEAHGQGLADEHRLVYVMLRSGVHDAIWTIAGVCDSPEEVKRLQGNPLFDWKVEVHAARDRVVEPSE